MLHIPLTEDQANNERQAMFDSYNKNATPFVVGECDFDVWKCEEKTTTDKNGIIIQQFVITLSCYDKNGTRAFVNCWIPETLKWKMREFYVSLNRMDLYKQDKLDPDMLVSCSGKLECFNKDVKKDGGVRTFINVKKFLAPDNLTQEPLNDVSSDRVDDDIPF